jgi:hypothetical protein
MKATKFKSFVCIYERAAFAGSGDQAGTSADYNPECCCSDLYPRMLLLTSALKLQ